MNTNHGHLYYTTVCHTCRREKSAHFVSSLVMAQTISTKVYCSSESVFCIISLQIRCLLHHTHHTQRYLKNLCSGIAVNRANVTLALLRTNKSLAVAPLSTKAKPTHDYICTVIQEHKDTNGRGSLQPLSKQHTEEWLVLSTTVIHSQ